MSLRCSLCTAEGRETYIERGMVVPHLEEVHADKIAGVKRWPDGEMVVVDKDELDAL